MMCRRQVDRAKDAEAHAAEYGDDSSNSSDEASSDEEEDGESDEYQKNIADARSVRARRYDANYDEEEGNEAGSDGEEEDWDDEDDNDDY